MLETGKPPQGKDAIRFYKMLVSAASRNDYVALQTSGDANELKETTLNQEETNMLDTLQKNRVVEPEQNKPSEYSFSNMFDRIKSNTNQDELALAGSTLL